MQKKLLVLCCACIMMIGSQLAFAGQTRVGGQLKLTVFDYADGTRNSLATSGYTGFQFTEADLYFNQEINDKVSVDIEPAFEATTMPTPGFGRNVGTGLILPSAASVSVEFRRALVKYLLPQGYELSCGIIKPRFSWEYGAELFYQDEIVGGKSSQNDLLGAMRDSGVEVYKSFECCGISLPSYVYAVNGLPSSAQFGAVYGDNNRNPFLMVHVEPEIGALKLLGSVGYGTWDALDIKSVNRWAAGLDYSYQKWNLRTECFAGAWQGMGSTGQDVLPLGYYAKLFYRVNPWLRAMLHYDIVDQNYATAVPGVYAPGRETYQTITPGVQFQVADSAQFIVQWDIANWRQTKASGAVEDLNFNRLVLGWRVVF
jgi:hypothetical protein